MHGNMQKGTNPIPVLSYSKEVAGIVTADDDSQLVLSSQEGNLDAFEQLVVKHQKKMLNVAFRLINDYDEACEVVQDTFISAYKSIKNFRGEAKFTTWLTSITVNLSKNRIKHMKSRLGRVAFSLDDPLQTNDGQLAIDLPSKEPSALDKLEKRNIQNKVRSCIQALRPDFREVLILRDMQDFSYEDIGSILKVRVGTVKSRLFRAREMVKDCLKRVIGEL
jgi:RNA polymerase sigma-70 factor, ECF subfamily